MFICNSFWVLYNKPTAMVMLQCLFLLPFWKLPKAQVLLPFGPTACTGAGGV